MKQAIGGAALAAALTLAACEGDPLSVPPDERFVVQAYLCAGRPVTDIRITSTLPLGSVDRASTGHIAGGYGYPEYEQLYTSLEQDTRDLNEPATNIENGIGIFTAFSSGDAFFTLVK